MVYDDRLCSAMIHDDLCLFACFTYFNDFGRKFRCHISFWLDFRLIESAMLRFIIRLFGRSVAPSDLFLRFQRLSTRSNRSTRPCHRPTSRWLGVGLGLCPQASRNGEFTQTFLLPGTLCGQVQGGWERLGMAKGEIVNSSKKKESIDLLAF